jgi:hypothetical protein
LAEILKANWEGDERLRLKIKKSPHKYGNNDSIADLYAAAMASYFSNKVNNVPNGRGGVYKASSILPALSWCREKKREPRPTAERREKSFPKTQARRPVWIKTG